MPTTTATLGLKGNNIGGQDSIIVWGQNSTMAFLADTHFEGPNLISQFGQCRT